MDPAIKEHTPHGGRGKQSSTQTDFDSTLSIDFILRTTLYCYGFPRSTLPVRHGTREGAWEGGGQADTK